MESSRREFVAGALAGGCAFCLSCGGGSEVRAAALKAGTVAVGSKSDYAADGIFDKFAGEQVMIVRASGKLYACSAICTHKERALKVVQGQMRCPSHGSRFDAEGKVIKGPAKQELVRFAISARRKRTAHRRSLEAIRLVPLERRGQLRRGILTSPRTQSLPGFDLAGYRSVMNISRNAAAVTTTAVAATAACVALPNRWNLWRPIVTRIASGMDAMKYTTLTTMRRGGSPERMIARTNNTPNPADSHVLTAAPIHAFSGGSVSPTVSCSSRPAFGTAGRK